MGPWCTFFQDDFTRREAHIFFRVNKKTVLLRNFFMHISLCLHLLANKIQAKRRLTRLSAVEPRQSTPTLKEVKKANLPVHDNINININAKSGEKTAKHESRFSK